MSYREVNDLRKSGKLDEALEMANADLEKDNSAWSYRAVFWVLHDMCKQCLANDQKDQATELVEKMKEILPNMDVGQESVAEKQVNFLEQQLSPFTAIIKQADQDSRDSHTVVRAFNNVKDIVCNDEIGLDDFQQRTAGWILYRYAKHQLEKKATYNVKLALSLYLKLKVEKPSPLHSSILRMAVELETEFRNDFKFTTFLEMWGFENFSEEDWEQFTTDDGRKLPCLVEKAIGRYCKELVDDHINLVPDKFVQLIEKARNKFPRDGKLELNYARLLAAQGDIADAVTAYRKVTERLPQPYIWQELADIIEDREIKQAILCKVITMQRDEQFLGDTRLKLAGQLIEEGNYAAAKRELETYHKARQDRGWAVRDPYYELAGKIPAGTQAPANNQSLYDNKLERLVSFMYPDAPTAVMFYNGKTFNNKNGKKRAKLIAPDGTSIILPPGRLPRHPSRQPYYFYTVKYINGERGLEALEIKPIDTQEGVQRFRVITGDVRIKTKADGKRFGFVEDCYIHQSMLGNVAEGQHLQVLAIKDKDGRFSAIALL